MKRLLMLAVLMALVPCMAFAQQSQVFLSPMPDAVAEYLERISRFWTIEDYCEVDTPQGDYGFALIWQDGVRALLGFREEGGEMQPWMDSMAAVPQTRGEASFDQRAAGSQIRYFWDDEGAHAYASDGMNFGVHVLDEAREAVHSSVYYEWEHGVFRLKHYRIEFCDVDIVCDTLYFWDIGNGLRDTVQAWVEQDVRRVDMERLPRQALDVICSAEQPPVIPWSHEENALCAELQSFAPGKKYPVYRGPGEEYGRAGNGKASVSTNSWIQVFGEHDGWLMIQYALDDARCRVGWIPRNALPKQQQLSPLSMQGGEWCVLDAGCTLTDDPLRSQTALCVLPKGLSVECMAKLGYGWTYIRAKIDGETWWGFVPADLLGRELE